MDYKQIWRESKGRRAGYYEDQFGWTKMAPEYVEWHEAHSDLIFASLKKSREQGVEFSSIWHDRQKLFPELCQAKELALRKWVDAPDLPLTWVKATLHNTQDEAP